MKPTEVDKVLNDLLTKYKVFSELVITSFDKERSKEMLQKILDEKEGKDAARDQASNN